MPEPIRIPLSPEQANVFKLIDAMEQQAIQQSPGIQQAVAARNGAVALLVSTLPDVPKDGQFQFVGDALVCTPREAPALALGT